MDGGRKSRGITVQFWTRQFRTDVRYTPRWTRDVDELRTADAPDLRQQLSDNLVRDMLAEMDELAEFLNQRLGEPYAEHEQLPVPSLVL